MRKHTMVKMAAASKITTSKYVKIFSHRHVNISKVTKVTSTRSSSSSDIGGKATLQHGDEWPGDGENFGLRDKKISLLPLSP